MLFRAAFAALAAATLSTASVLPRQSNTSVASVLPTSFKWSSTGPLIFPKDDGRNLAGIKDPTVVLVDGTYHVFASTSKEEGYNLVYLNFTSFEEASSAPFFYLDQAPLGTGYRAAPQVFYFAPQKLWYLVYQNGNAAYSTNPDISNPAAWTAPKTFYPDTPQIIQDGLEGGYWVDMWVICDDIKCHLFSSDDNGRLYRSETLLSQYPEGFTNTSIALSEPNKFDLFEAACIYKLANTDSYLLIVEAIGTDSQRWFRSWTSPSIEGPWTGLAASEDHPFARSNNVVFDGGAGAWTKSISHGEVIRSLTDQTLTIDPCEEGLQFLYQGIRPEEDEGSYNALPWKLALITLTNPVC
ncbi:Glycosyl hydrolase family 62 domain containing protein [Rhypophila decipiens]